MSEKDHPETEIVQKTLRRPIPIAGIGPTTGQAVSLVIRPARPNTGIMFIRRDAPPGEGMIETLWYDLAQPAAPNVITNKYGFSVGGIQPLVSLLRGFGIDNAVVEMDGPECPVTSDSARDILHVLEDAGTKLQKPWNVDREN